MTKSRLTTLIASALVVGLTVGTLGIANAAMRHQPRHHATAQTKAYTAAMHAVSPAVTLSKLTGLSVSAVMQLRASGESFAQIATDNGIDPATLVAQIVAARQAKLDALVAAGKLTEAQEQAILAKITAAVTAMIGRIPGSTATTDTMVPGTPMEPGAGVDATTPMTPGSGSMMTPDSGSATHTPAMTPGSGTDATAPATPGSGSPMTPDSGSATHTTTMTPGSGMTGGTTAPHAGSSMM